MILRFTVKIIDIQNDDVIDTVYMYADDESELDTHLALYASNNGWAIGSLDYEIVNP